MLMGQMRTDFVLGRYPPARAKITFNPACTHTYWCSPSYLRPRRRPKRPCPPQLRLIPEPDYTFDDVPVPADIEAGEAQDWVVQEKPSSLTPLLVQQNSLKTKMMPLLAVPCTSFLTAPVLRLAGGEWTIFTLRDRWGGVEGQGEYAEDGVV
ncbi:hypothetical protein B0H19DRAFT_1373884 [Mycena capillaripes]|nr:hypothetical protein B0H19DRAFT_1373884 [Mycena capillaripes]